MSLIMSLNQSINENASKQQFATGNLKPNPACQCTSFYHNIRHKNLEPFWMQALLNPINTSERDDSLFS